MDPSEYRAVVEKAATVKKSRTSREVEVEQALSDSMPKLLRELLNSHSGSKRPALRDLNEKLDAAGVEADVSPNTFYDWLDKYRLG
jgi:hypothetical protein